MASIGLRFHACIIDTEGVATDDEGDYFAGEVNLDLVIDGHVHHGLVAKVKQAAGSRFAEPLEVLVPSRYVGPLNYGRYRDCVERYVREQIASQRGELRAAATPFRVHDIRLPGEGTCSFVV
jgi:hypothetical protein